MSSIHDGHRQRLRGRFIEYGMESFTDIEALELLLFYAVPRRDTNALAHALLEYFGSYRGVMEADLDTLEKVPGIGENAAVLIKLVAAHGTRYQAALRSSIKRIGSVEDAGAYLRPFFAYAKRELLYLMCLDARQTVIRCHLLAEGASGQVNMAARDVVELALFDKAVSVILAHNHPSGIALPSDSDIATTKHLQEVLSLVGVELCDHLIFADDEFVSLRDSRAGDFLR